MKKNDPISEEIYNKVEKINEIKAFRESISIRRRELNILYKKELIKVKKYKDELLNIFTMIKNGHTKKINNLMKYLINEIVIQVALEKIRPNKGANTPGITSRGIDRLTDEDILEISNQLKNGTYKFSPVKRIYIEKPGKKEKRPLGIPDFKDRVVQEAIRVILSAIFEPEFQKLEVNYGFRPNRSVHDVIDKIVIKGKGSCYAIEGDIKKAYDTVNLDKMIQILQDKIDDKKFIKLIKRNFQSGLIDKGKFEHTVIGVPQGGITSPILFNIYMHEFDKHITEYLKQLEIKINSEPQRQKNVDSRKYISAGSKIRSIRKSLERQKSKINNAQNEQDKQNQKIKYRSYVKEFIKRRSISFKIKSKSQFKSKIRFLFIRYADDWIILNNASKQINLELKSYIKDWLQNNLHLNLSDEKTFITDIKRNPAKFLGFEITNNQRKPIIIRKKINNRKVRLGLALKIKIDKERIKNRLKLKGFLDKNFKPTHKKLFVALQPERIIEKYKQILEGLFLYYYPAITFKSSLASIYYKLTTSCLFTLACRTKKTTNKILNEMGGQIKKEIIYERKNIYSGKISKKSKEIKIHSYTELMKITMARSNKLFEYNEKTSKVQLTNIKELQKIREHKNMNDDPLNLNINIRTPHKLKNYCPLCGSVQSKENPIELHHVSSVKRGKEIGFTKEIMRVINKKTITCCRKCHKSIHAGKYNGKDLRDFFDPGLLLF